MATLIQQPKQASQWGDFFTKFADSLISWSWSKKLLYWIVLSAGTASECIFLIASLWVTINASVHSFILLFLSEQTTIHLTELATVAYVGLPECILALAIVTTLSHIKVWLYSQQKDYPALAWSILYGIPTLVFLILSVITIGNSMLSTTFHLPPYLIVTRGLCGYLYGLIALLHAQLGTPQERERLQKKDTLMETLRKEKDAAFLALKQQSDRLQLQLQTLQETARAHDARQEQRQAETACLQEELQQTKHLLMESQSEQARLAQAVFTFQSISEQEEDTQDTPGEIPIVNAQKPRKLIVSKQTGNASSRVYKVLKSNPNATVTQIMDKAKVSRGYASRIRSQWMNEQAQSA